MPESSSPSPQEKMAQFKFGIVGPLLAAPPERGELAGALEELAAKTWRDPLSGEPTTFALSTIERWYYEALREQRDPVKALSPKIRKDSGTHPSIAAGLAELIRAQHLAHPSWTYKLHADNLAVTLAARPEIGRMPSYTSVRRFMKACGMLKRPRRGPAGSPGGKRAEHRFEHREVRSYQSEHVGALWHCDYHHGSARVATSTGRWKHPVLFAVLDDCSRLCCHAQWYLDETAENLVHGLCQAILKHDLPRALMSDNGGPMTAEETTQGLERLGVVHETTLPYSPYQNGKQESFWARVESRLMAMLEGVADLTLQKLNEATQAWVEMEYNRGVHGELGRSPLDCYVHGNDVGRPTPTAEALSVAFTARATRVQRRSDGTVSLKGTRFEVPARYGHFPQVHLRYASWDLSRAYLCDPKTREVICTIHPQDKHRNANATRGAKTSLGGDPPANEVSETSGEMAPLLRKLLADYVATGKPPGYLPQAPSSEGTV
jgi:transposase InsO family protein